MAHRIVLQVAGLMLSGAVVAQAAMEEDSTRSHAAAPSAYAGQETRAIKALSPAEQADLLAGKGMGLAKAAELNGYPGPLHVLALASQLELTQAQQRDTEALFKAMQSRAQGLGSELVEAERALDMLFVRKQASQPELSQALARIGDLQAQLRTAHLEAHLEQTRILTANQIAKYNELRGYAADVGSRSHDGQHRH
jgi:Spy/CpxP family protein refolding chaperone